MLSTMTEASLFLVVPESGSRQAIASGLPACYQTREFSDVKPMLAALDGSPDLIVCHQSLLAEQQASQLSRIRDAAPSSRIVVLGPRQPISTQIIALKHGARGYFDESLPVSRLHEALQLILRGEVWVERHVISGLIDEISHKPTVTAEQKQALASLSPKELEVAELVSHGATNKMIARKMDITERTVKAHLTAIFQKMHIPDRLSLAILFRDLR